MKIRSILSVVLSLALLSALACQSGSQPSSHSPKGVAERLIQALDQQDKKALTSLVAAESAEERKETVRLWQASYAPFAHGKTRVTNESIVKNRAIVIASGQDKHGAPKTLHIDLTHDDGSWKVLPKPRVR